MCPSPIAETRRSVVFPSFSLATVQPTYRQPTLTTSPFSYSCWSSVQLVNLKLPQSGSVAKRSAPEAIDATGPNRKVKMDTPHEILHGMNDLDSAGKSGELAQASRNHQNHQNHDAYWVWPACFRFLGLATGRSPLFMVG
ncbi:hypothetical protein PG994_012183 [Apiospora phragmitis]|uniref:Uncharacterized protein n=1 Tax=Apiospora phragmitis TaxID=2905665 RepID=A0ABR1TV77_9PEZI